MFSNFVDSLPTKVRSTNDFEYGTRFRTKANAIAHRYIEVNQFYKKYIVIDIDDIDGGTNPRELGSAFLWEERRLPPPTYVVINPANARCHYYYELNTPVYYTANARRAPQNYYENTDLALTSVLGADSAYAGKFAKNPMHESWRTIYHNARYDLEDFAEWGLDLSTYKKKRKVERELGGRNTTLFNELRKLAYVEVKKTPSYDLFQQYVDSKALSINKTFVDCQYGVLSAKETLSTGKSVGNWTWRHQATIGNGDPNKGIMQLPADMSLKAKQAAGALHSATTRQFSTLDAVVNAAIALRASGLPITQQSVSIRAEVSVPSVRKYWNEVDRALGLYKR